MFKVKGISSIFRIVYSKIISTRRKNPLVGRLIQPEPE